MAFDYSVKVSRRAKSARLKVSAREGLLVIVPAFFDQARIPGILERKRDWIERHQERLVEQRKFLVPEPPGHRPERITLRMIGQEWAVDYRLTAAENVRAVERVGQRLLVFGDLDNEEATKDALRRWVSRKTREHVVPWLNRLAAENDFGINGVMVKSQRTRWASCSGTKNISVNVRLMFLPERLVRYVLLHELAHTSVMNHSRKYWLTLQALDPEYQTHDAELRTAWRLIPAWLGASPADNGVNLPGFGTTRSTMSAPPSSRLKPSSLFDIEPPRHR